MSSQLIDTVEVTNAEELHAFLDDVLAEAKRAGGGVLSVGHPELGQITEASLVERTLADGSKVLDVLLSFEGERA